MLVGTSRSSAAAWLAVLLVVATGRAGVAVAQDSAAETGEGRTVEDPPPAGMHVLAGVAAVIPGVAVHGSGHHALGDPDTGHQLLAMEGAGLGLLVGSLAGLALTGASRRTVAPLATLTAAGSSLFAISWLSDVYGVLARGAPRGDAPRRWEGAEARLGAVLVHDPVLPHRVLGRGELSLRAGRWRGGLALLSGLETPTHRMAARIAYRILGAPSRDGAFVDLGVAGRHHASPDLGFDATTGEVTVRGRLPLRSLSPSLEGCFAELGGGWALESRGYDAVEPRDTSDLLLVHAGWGLWAGSWPSPWAEVTLFYEHRRDTLAGGLKLPGVGVGFAGSFGLSTEAWLTERWGLAARGELGSAAVVELSAIYRHGGT